MKPEDKRPRIRKYAQRATSLTWRERMILAALTELPNEVDAETGQSPRDCYAMRADGKFRHRQEYVADVFGMSPQETKAVFKSLRQKGALSPLHVSAHGRASAYQALILKGGENHPHTTTAAKSIRGGQNLPTTSRENHPLTNSEDPAIRGGQNHPLTYKTPDDRNHTPTSRGFQEAQITKKSAATREHDSTSAASRVTAPLVVSTHCQHGIENGDQPDPWLKGDLVCTQCRALAKAAS